MSQGVYAEPGRKGTSDGENKLVSNGSKMPGYCGRMNDEKTVFIKRRRNVSSER